MSVSQLPELRVKCGVARHEQQDMRKNLAECISFSKLEERLSTIHDMKFSQDLYLTKNISLATKKENPSFHKILR